LAPAIYRYAFGATTGTLPVLYLLHGYTDDDPSWVSVGKANLIAGLIQASDELKKPFRYVQMGVGDHNWLLWRGYLVDFLPKFSDTASSP
jgi:hypothetical protein